MTARDASRNPTLLWLLRQSVNRMIALRPSIALSWSFAATNMASYKAVRRPGSTLRRALRTSFLLSVQSRSTWTSSEQLTIEMRSSGDNARRSEERRVGKEGGEGG